METKTLFFVPLNSNFELYDVDNNKTQTYVPKRKLISESNDL